MEAVKPRSSRRSVREGRSARGGRQAEECRGRMHKGRSCGRVREEQGTLRPTRPQTETLHRG